MAGGVERMATLIMNEMVSRGFRIALLTWDLDYAESHYQLDPRISWLKLNLGSPHVAAGNILRLKRQLSIRRIVKQIQPHITISFQVGTFIALRTAIFGLGIPCIAAERNSRDLFNFVKRGRLQKFFADLSLLLADCVTIQFHSYYKQYLPMLRRRIVVIPNPVMPVAKPAIFAQHHESVVRILNVGRLSYQKNQVFLLLAFAKISALYPNHILTIVGEGEMRPKLENTIKCLNLVGKVQLIGAVADVDEWYRKSSFFVFPSLWEGFPNSLVEALSHGLPAVGLAQTAGVNELIKPNENGLLSPNDVSNFSSAMKFIIDDDDFRKRAGIAARESVQHCSPQAIFDDWEQLFTALSR